MRSANFGRFSTATYARSLLHRISDATPAAIASGLSRTARLGVVVKGGGALETLGRARTLVLDKTGTLTQGCPEVVDVVAAEVSPQGRCCDWQPPSTVSSHVLAAAIIRTAEERGVEPIRAAQTHEEAGSGTTGIASGRLVHVGRRRKDLSSAWMDTQRARAALDSAMTVWVTVDGVIGGVIFLVMRSAPTPHVRCADSARPASIGW